MTPPDISNPRRLLVLGQTNSGILQFLQGGSVHLLTVMLDNLMGKL